MPLQRETAPAKTTGRLQKLVCCEGLNNSGDTPDPASFQAPIVDLDLLDELMEAGKNCERELARRQLRLRRFLLNLAVYRHAVEKFGEAVWRDAV